PLEQHLPQREWTALSRAGSHFSRSQKRRKYEASIENRNINGTHAASSVRLACSTRQDRLRPQCKLWAIQDLLVGKGPNERPAPGRPHQERSEQRSGGKRLDAGALGR